jgi:uncharacterized Zn-binding protein involved in type VI secretion
MPGFVQRVGDANILGGIITSGDPTVLVNGRPVATLGSSVSPHEKHVGATTTSNTPKILVGGKPICTAGTVDTCGDPRIKGSTDVIAGG